MLITVDAGCRIYGVITLDPRLLCMFESMHNYKKKNALMSCHERKDYDKVKNEHRNPGKRAP